LNTSLISNFFVLKKHSNALSIIDLPASFFQTKVFRLEISSFSNLSIPL